MASVLAEDVDEEEMESLHFVVVRWLIQNVHDSIGALITSPLTRILSVYQCQNELIRLGRLDRPYANLFDCAKRVATEDTGGLTSLWRGWWVPALRGFVNAPVYALLRDPLFSFLLSKLSHIMSGIKSPFLRWACASALSVVTTSPSQLVLSPLFYMQVQLQCDISPTPVIPYRFSSALQVLRTAYDHGGLLSFATGLGAKLLSGVAERRATVLVYDFLAARLVQNLSMYGDEVVSMSLYTCMQIAGVAVAWPLTTIRRRMILAAGGAQTRDGRPAKYASAVDCARQIYFNEGALALWIGAPWHLAGLLMEPVVTAAFDNLVTRIFDRPPLE